MTQTVGLITFFAIVATAVVTVSAYLLVLKYGGSSTNARIARAKLRFRARATVTPWDAGDGCTEYTYRLAVYDRRRTRYVSYELFMGEHWKKMTGYSEWMAVQFAKKDYYDFLRAWVEAEYRDKDAAKVEREKAKKFAVTEHKVG